MRDCAQTRLPVLVHKLVPLVELQILCSITNRRYSRQHVFAVSQPKKRNRGAEEKKGTKAERICRRATTHRPSFKIQNKPGGRRQWSSELGFRANHSARAHGRVNDKVPQRGNPTASSVFLSFSFSTLAIRNARAFYELVNVGVFFIYAAPRSRSNDTRAIEKSPRDLTSVAGTAHVAPMIFVLLIFFLVFLFLFMETRRNTVTSSVAAFCFRKFITGLYGARKNTRVTVTCSCNFWQEFRRKPRVHASFDDSPFTSRSFASTSQFSNFRVSISLLFQRTQALLTLE